MSDNKYNSAEGLPISGLKSGSANELITWNSGGTPETIAPQYGEMLSTGGGAYTIDTQNVEHFLSGLSAGNVNGVTFANIVSTAITAFADAGGGQVTVTSNAHGLSNDDWITITGTTNYNGVFQVSNKTTNTFEITDTWVADDGTGKINYGSKLKIAIAGFYQLNWAISGNAADNNQVFTFTPYVNGTAQTNAKTIRKFSTGGDVGAVSGTCILDLSANDVLTLAMLNQTSAGNITPQESSINIVRVR